MGKPRVDEESIYGGKGDTEAPDASEAEPADGGLSSSTPAASSMLVGADGVLGRVAMGGVVGLVVLALLVAIVSVGGPPPPPPAAVASAPPSPLATQAAGESLFVGAAEVRSWQLQEDGVLLLDAREAPQWGAASHIEGTSCALSWKSLSRWAEGGADKSVLQPTPALQRRLRECGLRASPAQRVVVYGDWSTAWGEEGRLLWALEFLSPATGGRFFVLRGGFAA